MRTGGGRRELRALNERGWSYRHEDCIARQQVGGCFWGHGVAGGVTAGAKGNSSGVKNVQGYRRPFRCGLGELFVRQRGGERGRDGVKTRKQVVL